MNLKRGGSQKVLAADLKRQPDCALGGLLAALPVEHLAGLGRSGDCSVESWRHTCSSRKAPCAVAPAPPDEGAAPIENLVQANNASGQRRDRSIGKQPRASKRTRLLSKARSEPTPWHQNGSCDLITKTLLIRADRQAAFRHQWLAGFSQQNMTKLMGKSETTTGTVDVLGDIDVGASRVVADPPILNQVSKRDAVDTKGFGELDYVDRRVRINACRPHH